jgi:hypothetical protein
MTSQQTVTARYHYLFEPARDITPHHLRLRIVSGGDYLSSSNPLRTIVLEGSKIWPE